MLNAIILNDANNPFILSVIMPNVTHNPFMLSVIMLNVIMQSVVPPLLRLRFAIFIQ
jgi:hypothetical protein